MRLPITFFAALIGVPLFGATINSITFSQIDYTQNGAVTVPRSSSAYVTVSYTQDAEGISFFNVVQDGGPGWILQNFPLLSTAQTGTTTFKVATYSNLGVANGTNLVGSAVNFIYTVTAEPMGTAPTTGTNGTATVGSAQQCLNCGIIGAPTSTSGSISPAAVKPADTPPSGASNTREIHLKNMDQRYSYPQGKNQCLTGAATNSIQWLAGQNPNYKLNQTAPGTLLEMNEDMNYNPANGGTYEANAVSGLVQYVGAHSLPLQVHYYGGGGSGSSNSLPTTTGFTPPGSTSMVPRSGDVTFDGLFQELQNQQNVIAIVVGTNDQGENQAHAIDVTGATDTVDADGNHSRSVEYFDDTVQDNGANSTEQGENYMDEKVQTWREPSGGSTRPTLGGATLYTLIVESPIPPPPPTQSLFTGEYGFLPGTSSESSCNTIAPFVSPFHQLMSFPLILNASGTFTAGNNANPSFSVMGTLNNLTGTLSGTGVTEQGEVQLPITFTLQPYGYVPGGPLVNAGVINFNGGVCTLPFLSPYIGPQAPLFGSSPAIVGDPISADTGELIEEPSADLSLGGPLPLEFRRYYGSLLGVNGIAGALGGNWMSNFDVTAFVSGTSANVVTFRGGIIRFALSGGVWKPSANYRLGYQFQTVASGFQFLDPGSNLIFSFANNGKLTGISDRNGNALTVTQGPNGPAQVADGLGRTLTFTYTGSNLTKVQDQSGRSVSYSYSGGNLTTFIDANGKTTSYSTTSSGLSSLITRTTRPVGNVQFSQNYDANGRVTSQSDGNGNTSSLVYSRTVAGNTAVSDARGNTWTQSQPNLFEFTGSIDPNGNYTVTNYDANGRPISVVDRNGNTSLVTYHSPSGYVASQTDAEGNTTTLSYTASVSSGFTFFDLTGIQFADGTSVSYSRDANGNLLKRTDAAGKTTTFAYNNHGQPATATNASGGVTTYSYGADGTVATVKSPAGDVTGYVYDTLKRPTLIKFADGTTRSLTYDALDRVTQTVDERSKATALAYTDNSEISSVTDPLGDKTSFTYDAADHPTAVTTPSGATVTAYNQVSLPSSIKAPTGETGSFAYDALNRVTTVKDTAGQLAAFTYDNEGGLVSATDGGNRQLVFGLDRVGRRLTATTPLSEVWRSTFDKRGRVSSRQDPLGQTTTFTYDANGRLSALALPGAIQASYARDGLGNTTSATDPNGSVWTRAFDNMGRFSSRTDPLGRATSVTYDQRNRVASASSIPARVQFNYDAAGRLNGAAYGDGTNLSYTFDDADRLTGANGAAFTLDGNGAIVNSNGLAITRDASERITSIGYPPGAVTYAYDQRGDLSQISDWTGAKTSFTYDGSLRMTGIARANGVTTQYTYDADGHLSGITETLPQNSAFVTSITRDADGRIASSNRAGPPIAVLCAGTTACTGPAPGLLGLTYDAADQISGATYDGLGRVTQDSIRGYQWDLASRLTSYSGADGTASFTYDGLGSRISRTSQATTQNFTLNYALGLPSVAIVKNGSSDQRYYVYLPDGSLLYGVDAGGTVHHYFHFDESGNTLFLSDDSGSLTDFYNISAYGESVFSTGLTANPFTWQGRFGVMQESGTSMFYLRARYFDSAPARFLSPHPIAGLSPLRINPYLYALANPATLSDPTGLMPGVATFSTNFPSLWDFRPGDDAYDAVQPYIDNYDVTGSPVNSFGNPYPGISVPPLSPFTNPLISVFNNQPIIGNLNAPGPSDRVFFNYNYYNTVSSPVRDTFGFEKTFLDGSNSISVRLPGNSPAIAPITLPGIIPLIDFPIQSPTLFPLSPGAPLLSVPLPGLQSVTPNLMAPCNPTGPSICQPIVGPTLFPQEISGLVTRGFLR